MYEEFKRAKCIPYAASHPVYPTYRNVVEDAIDSIETHHENDILLLKHQIRKLLTKNNKKDALRCNDIVNLRDYNKEMQDFRHLHNESDLF